jgi:hypothetical protein
MKQRRVTVRLYSDAVCLHDAGAHACGTHADASLRAVKEWHMFLFNNLKKKLVALNAILLGLVATQGELSAGNPICDETCRVFYGEKYFCSGSCTKSVYKGMNIYTCSGCGS